MESNEIVRKWTQSNRIVDKILIDPEQGYLITGPADVKTIIRWPSSTDCFVEACAAPTSVEYILSAEEMYYEGGIFVKNVWRQFLDGEPMDEPAFIEDKRGRWLVCRSTLFHHCGTLCEYLGWRDMRREIWRSDITLVPMFEDARTHEGNFHRDQPPFSFR